MNCKYYGCFVEFSWAAGYLDYLHSDLRQVDLQGQLLPAVHVRVMGLLESSFQLVELEGGECGPVPAVLLLGVLIVGQFPVPVRWVRARRGFRAAAATADTCGGRTESFELIKPPENVNNAVSAPPEKFTTK